MNHRHERILEDINGVLVQLYAKDYTLPVEYMDILESCWDYKPGQEKYAELCDTLYQFYISLKNLVDALPCHNQFAEVDVHVTDILDNIFSYIKYEADYL